MYCKKCGKDNFEGVRVCAGCGAEMPVAAAGPIRIPQTTALKTSPMAIWSLVLSIAGCFTCVTAILGLILGIMGLNQINARRNELTGRGLAIAGIVIACIVIVIDVLIMPAILFPVFVRAREAARSGHAPADCMSRAKALGASMRMYISDYQGTYPPAASWSDALKPYNAKMGTGDMVYRCPAAPGLACGYGLNASVGGQPEGIMSSSKTILLFESDRGWNGFGGPEAMITQPRHRSFTICCVDGHGIRVFPGYENRLRWSP
jgi:hypothetical protein